MCSHGQVVSAFAEANQNTVVKWLGSLTLLLTETYSPVGEVQLLQLYQL